jgi:hypothetical protein
MLEQLQQLNSNAVGYLRDARRLSAFAAEGSAADVITDQSRQLQRAANLPAVIRLLSEVVVNGSRCAGTGIPQQ